MKTSNRKGNPVLVVLIVIFTIIIAASLIFLSATDQGKAWAVEIKGRMPEPPTVEVEMPRPQVNVSSRPTEVNLGQVNVFSNDKQRKE